MEQHCKDLFQTQESYHPLMQLQLNSQGSPLMTQIQKFTSSLIKKKAEFREQKLKEKSFIDRTNSQECRIAELKIMMDHEIQKEKIELTNRQNLTDNHDDIRKEIKELLKRRNMFKEETNKTMVKIQNERKVCEEFENLKKEMENNLKELKKENEETDEYIQSIEAIMSNAENSIREKQEFISSQQMKETQLQSVINFVKQKKLLLLKQVNSEFDKKSHLTDLMIKIEQKINNIKKQKNQTEWSSEQSSAQNFKIEQLNKKLKDDLSRVKKHLLSVEKTTKTLKDSLLEYGIVSEKVARLVIH